MFKRAEEDRFEREIVPHLDSGYNLAVWLLRNSHDAEDALQNAAIKAHQRLGSMRGGSAKAWFLAIVRNECMNSARGKKMEWSLSEERDAPLACGSPEEEVLQRIQAENISAAINALDAPYREAILLREIEGLSYAEIGSVAQIPIGTVMSRLSRARKMLIEWLKEKERA